MIPVYESRIGAPTAQGMTVAPMAIPDLPDGSQLGRAMAGTFDALGAFAVARQRAAEETEVARATTDYITKLDGLRDKFERDPDFTTAPQRFAKERAELERDLSGGILNQETREKLKLRFRSLGITAQNAVDKTNLARESGANVAALDDQERHYLRAAAGAGSETEKQAAIAGYHGAVDSAARSLWIGQGDALARKVKFARYIENADIMRAIRVNPAAAAARLADPAAFPNIDPVTREGYINQARIAVDDMATQQLVNRARFKPAIASLELGRIADVTHADEIFRDGVIPQEGGKGKISPAGAIGISQLMPATARELLTKAGMADVAKLDDKALEKRLLEDEALNLRLGRTYFREMLGRYEGNVALALAAYNAGPGRADEWKRKAEAKHGAAFTPAQLVDVIGIKETRDYVAGIYDRMGASIAGAGISPAATFKAVAQLKSELSAQETARSQAARDLASTMRTADDIVRVIEGGYAVDENRLSEYRRAQAAAAAKGSQEAAAELRRVDEAVAMAPFAAEAWRTPPARIKAVVADMEAMLRAEPNVTGDQVRRLEAFKKVAETIETQKNKDPIALGERAGFYKPVEIDPAGDASNAQWQRSLAIRGQQAVLAQQTYGGGADPFKEAEAAALKQRWTDAAPAERLGLLRTFASTMPESVYRAAVAQVAGKDALTEFVGLIARDRPELAGDILRGQALLASKEIGTAGKEVRAALEAKFDRQIYPSPNMQNAVVSAALAKYTADRGAAGALYSPTDEAGIEAAIEAVTGPIVARNGRKVPLPPTLGRRRATELLDNLTDDDVATQGGAMDRRGKDLSAADISRHAWLVPERPGGARFFVLMPSPDNRGAPVLNREAMPLVLDLASIDQRRRSLGLDRPFLPDLVVSP